MQKGKLILFISGLILLLMVCGSWGFLAHRTVNQLAVYELPGKLRVFFHQNLEYMVKNAPRPDIRRGQDSTEATKHFIDFEAFGDSAQWKMPAQWDEVLKLYSQG